MFRGALDLLAIRRSRTRTGRTVEFKRGHHYLTVTRWEDGHCEIEVHKCVPELVFHTCDPNELSLARDTFLSLATSERLPLTCRGCGANLEGTMVKVLAADRTAWCERCFETDHRAVESTAPAKRD